MRWFARLKAKLRTWYRKRRCRACGSCLTKATLLSISILRTSRGTLLFRRERWRYCCHRCGEITLREHRYDAA